MRWGLGCEVRFVDLPGNRHVRTLKTTGVVWRSTREVGSVVHQHHDWQITTRQRCNTVSSVSNQGLTPYYCFTKQDTSTMLGNDAMCAQTPLARLIFSLFLKLHANLQRDSITFKIQSLINQTYSNSPFTDHMLPVKSRRTADVAAKTAEDVTCVLAPKMVPASRLALSDFRRIMGDGTARACVLGNSPSVRFWVGARAPVVHVHCM